MSWRKSLIERLVAGTPGGYGGGPAATEPTAWAAMALAGAGEEPAARRACEWLAEHQARDGSLGVSPQQATPGWPTSLAVLAWRRYSAAFQADRFGAELARAVDWSLATRGKTIENKPDVGHDTTIVGWSWAADTHSWLEPTAMFVRALVAAGRADHERTRHGARLLVDRLLPTGGANYGNTRVIDQYLLPHVQPTGLAMWALAAASVTEASDPRVEASLDYLQDALARPMGTASLAYAVLGLAAHGRRSPRHDALLAKSFASPSATASTYKLALLALAAEHAGAE